MPCHDMAMHHISSVAPQNSLAPLALIAADGNDTGRNDEEWRLNSAESSRGSAGI